MSKKTRSRSCSTHSSDSEVYEICSQDENNNTDEPSMDPLTKLFQNALVDRKKNKLNTSSHSGKGIMSDMYQLNTHSDYKSDSGSEFFRSCFPETALNFTTPKSLDATVDDTMSTTDNDDADASSGECTDLIRMSDTESDEIVKGFKGLKYDRYLQYAKSNIDLRLIVESMPDVIKRTRSEIDLRNGILPTGDDLVAVINDMLSEDQQFRQVLSWVF